MMVEFFTRGLTVLLGVGIVLFLPRAMFWPRRRQPYALLLFLMVEILTVSVVFAAILRARQGAAGRMVRRAAASCRAGAGLGVPVARSEGLAARPRRVGVLAVR